MLERLQTLASSLTTAQKASLAGVFVAVVALVTGSSYLINRQDYVLLFSDLDAESAADVTGRLKSAKVDYQLVDGGRAVRVPQNKADELRLEFASQGLPTSGRIGFEIFDKLSFGATEFVEQVNFRRALEGEIARTISTISEVSSARVHIAVAKNSLFEQREQPAKASVVLKLKGNRPLSEATARGICTLVAAAVEGLKPDAVVILDSYGRPLVRPGEGGDGNGGLPPVERQLIIERDLKTNLVAMLEPVVGTGRVRVNVAVRLNPQSEEQTEERWDPNSPVVRSKQTTSDLTPLANVLGGVAGTRANLPDPAAAAKPGQPAADAARPVPETKLAGKNAETTNYEISHSTRHTIRPMGEVARLSVAVIVDDRLESKAGKDGKVVHAFKPREREDLLKIQNIVTSAVGIDTARGDQLTVENVAFEDRLPIGEPEVPTFWQKQTPQFMELGRILGVLAVGFMAFFMFVRPVVKRALATAGPSMTSSVESAPALPGQTETPRTVADLEGAIEAELEAAEANVPDDRRKIPVLAKRLGGMTKKEPEQAARLVRTWIQEDRAGK
jgi:flagellar M-ring protein FliF